MKAGNRILTTVFICMLVLSACVPAAVVPKTQAPAPTATIIPTPTPRPEKNVSLNKPVRVSASWVVDPPERAVNGNANDWWGAGGPAPAWIEVDLEGIYSVSKIRVVNEGPTGSVPYQVFGRGPDNATRLLHVFEGSKSQNQTIEFSPETPWEDISTIRIEINSGTGWVGFREVQVFSRDEPRSLLESDKDKTPSFLAEVHADELAPITSGNAIFMEQLAMFGRGPVNEIAWSPDGKTLAVASPLGIWLYDPSDLKSSPLLLEGHTRDVLSVIFSPDGKTVLSGSQDGTVKQWDAVTGDLKRTISLWNDFSYEVGDQKRDSEVWSIAFSPDGKLLAAGAYNGTLRLWDLSTGKQSAVLKGHTSLINNLAFSPDGTLLATSGVDSTLFVWDVAKESQLAALPIPGQVQSLVFSPDGKTLAYGGTGMSVRLWDTIAGEESVELSELDGVLSLAFSSDSLTLASSSIDGSVRLWDGESASSRIFKERVGWITNMAFSPDGTTLISSTWDGVMQLWETATGDQTALLLDHTTPVNSIAFNPDGTILAVGSEDSMIRLWEVETNSLYTILLGHAGRVSSVAFSPDGRFLASGSFDDTVRLWDVLKRSQVAILSGHESFIRCVAFSPDGKLVASGSTDKTVRLWDVATGEERSILTGHTSEVQSVAFSPDGKWLVSASTDFTLRIWDVATGMESGVLKGHTSFAISAAFSPDGTVLASSGGDHSLRVWNWKVVSGAATGMNRFTPIGHGGWVLSVAFSPDGKIIASANVSTTSYWVAPGEIHLYSSDTGYPYALLRGHTKRVTSIAFSPDGKLLASGSADGSVRLWGVVGDGSPSGLPQTPQTAPTAPTSTPKPVDWDPFVGEWTATDPHDGSNMTLTIMRSDDGNYNITLIDDGARGCGVNSAGQPKFGIEIVFTATAIGSTLYADSTAATCLSTPASLLNVEIHQNFLYQEATDTLWDDANRTDWKRH